MTETLDISHSRWIFEQQTEDQALHHSGKSVRELVISKQSSRVFPVDNRLIGRMEDQLVRWKRPASSHLGTMQVIEGTHPYQQEPMSMSQTWSQIKDAFSKKIQKAAPEYAEDGDDTSIELDESSVLNEDLYGCNLETAVTQKAVPVTLIAPPQIEDTSIQERYSYHYPIPQYYLPPDERSGNSNQAATEDGATCSNWLCFNY